MTACCEYNLIRFLLHVSLSLSLCACVSVYMCVRGCAINLIIIVCVSLYSRDIREGDLQAGSGTTYWWMTEPVLFPFGAGLEYTTFQFSWGNDPPATSISLPDSRMVLDIPDTDVELQKFSVDYSVVVANTGHRASPVVVLAFVMATPSSPPGITPVKKLFGFERIKILQPGNNVTVSFACNANSLGIVDEAGAKLLMAGRYRVEIGSVSAPAVRELELRGNDIKI
eukprot:COSAG02_NODE_4585_length_5189_cov_9.203929_8_plen_226_part_00